MKTSRLPKRGTFGDNSACCPRCGGMGTVPYNLGTQPCPRCRGGFVKLTKAQVRALEAMAANSTYMLRGKESIHNVCVNSLAARHLEELGLAKSRAVWISDGRPVPSRLVTLDNTHEWATGYTITREGMRAIGWIGEVLR